ncbi:MAG: AFG1 family ATPase [Burkholderiaceae bacterium]|nr:AFG1 family ATPase [Burkholderiaceae bacterium]
MLEHDPAQLEVAAELDRLIDEISARRLETKSSALGWLFARRHAGRAPVRGLYIHGAVGRGKTMLMDLFFELVPVRRKRRAHFNDFMADVHSRIHAHRQARKAGKTSQDDPIPPVAAALGSEAWVLCFDEFSVTDITDAMILSRLFSALFAQGVVLVATSNVAPEALYRDGLNRQLFLPFIDILERHTRVLTLDARTDYRLEKLDRLPVYMTPLDDETARQMDLAWATATDGMREEREEITVMGRAVEVPRAVKGAARFDFSELCGRPLGARDYLAIAARYHTVFVDNVPALDARQRNEAKRFILLIDTLYDHRNRLVISAAAAPDGIYAETRGTEAFEFERTASRLIEMQSQDYLSASKASAKAAA